MTQAGIRPSAPALARLIGIWNSYSEAPAYRNLAFGLRAAVLDGRLTLNTQLPAEREFALALNVSRTTVAGAYSLLREDGWVRSRRGSGSVIQLPADASTEHGGLSPFGPVSYWGAPVPGDVEADLIDLTTASLPAPLGPLRSAVAAASDDLPVYAADCGYFPLGLPALRSVVARGYAAAGVPTAPEQILITNGAQHALTIILAALSEPGDRVLVESPTYPVALDAIRGARRVPTPLGLRTTEDNPWDVELLAATMRQSAPVLAYLQPDFQNPTGALMPAETRKATLQVARRNNVMVIVDESLRDVPFDSHTEMPDHFCADDRDGRVLSVGSLSKALWGGLRVGWVRTTKNLVSRLGYERALGDMAGPVFDQLIALHMLADPEAALTEQRARLSAGCIALSAALAANAPDWARTNPRGGASLWVQLPAAVATEAARLAPQAGVRVVPGPRFGPDGTMDGYLRLPFTASADRLTAAVPRLVTAVEAAMKSSGGTRLDNWLT